MEIYIGAENIISPLGNTAEENFDAFCKNITGIKKTDNRGYNNETLFLSAFDASLNYSFDLLLKNCLTAIQKKTSKDILTSESTLVILSTTKGDIKNSSDNVITNSISILQKTFNLKNTPLVISNACASGVIAINTAADLIRNNYYHHVIVLGCDIISDFVIYGFQSLFALSDTVCKPYDKNRKGISLGEGCAGLLLSSEKSVFNQLPVQFLEGSSSNDANHISGPSRTGEGLFRSVKKTLRLANIREEEIDFISAHGTATIYNDDMESVAFNRLNMQHIPLNSFKGYIGHTLGAAGVIETAMCIQCMRNNTVIKSYGFENDGTTEKINVISKSEAMQLNTVLKTASGFGGCNATLILKKI